MIAQSLRQKIAWSTLVQFLGKTLAIAMGIFSVRWTARALGPEEMGFFRQMTEFALFFSNAASLGLFANIVRKMSEAPEDGTLFFNAFVLRTGSAFLILSAGLISAWLYGFEEAFLMGLSFFLCSLFLDFITQSCDALLQAQYKMGRSMVALLSGRVLELCILFSIISFWPEASTPLYFLAPLSASVLTCLIVLVFVSRSIKWRFTFQKETQWQLFISSLPFGIINVLNGLYFRYFPSLVLATTLSESQFSSYSLQHQMVMTASLFSTYLMYSSLPALHQAIREKNTQLAQNLLKRLRQFLLGLGVAMVLLGKLLGPWALSIISGSSEYLNFTIPGVLLLLLILGAISYFYDLVLVSLLAFEKELWQLKIEALAVGLGLLGIFIASRGFPTNLTVYITLASAILAQSFVVLLGLRRLENLLKFDRV